MSLNIFEPRYRLMVRRCMQGTRRFAMTGRRHAGRVSDELCPVACEVEITECVALPDGRFGVHVVGRRRLRLGEVRDVDGLLYATPIDTRAGAPAGAPSPELAARVAEVERRVDAWVDRLQELVRVSGPRMRGYMVEPWCYDDPSCWDHACTYPPALHTSDPGRLGPLCTLTPSVGFCLEPHLAPPCSEQAWPQGPTRCGVRQAGAWGLRGALLLGGTSGQWNGLATSPGSAAFLGGGIASLRGQKCGTTAWVTCAALLPCPVLHPLNLAGRARGAAV